MDLGTDARAQKLEEEKLKTTRKKTKTQKNYQMDKKSFKIGLAI